MSTESTNSNQSQSPLLSEVDKQALSDWAYSFEPEYRDYFIINKGTPNQFVALFHIVRYGRTAIVYFDPRATEEVKQIAKEICTHLSSFFVGAEAPQQPKPKSSDPFPKVNHYTILPDDVVSIPTGPNSNWTISGKQLADLLSKVDLDGFPRIST